MWKLTIVAGLLAVSYSANVDQILGSWTTVVVSPDKTIPYCIQYFIAKEDNTQCTCVDGKATAYLKFGMHNGPTMEKMPVSVVNSSNEVMDLLNVTCSCAGQELPRSVGRRAHDNYIVLYFMSHHFQYTDKDPNTAHMMAKTIPTEAQLMKDLEGIGEFNNRTAGAVCTQEIKEMYFKNQ